jgi:HlyD family secretion protein
MARRIFRQVALERLSSPEQLDQLLTITNPIGWMALFAIGGLLLVAILWGIYGNIPTNVQGQGIILKKGGLVTIQAQNPGTITALNVEVGALIQKGDIIARLQQDALLEQIRKAQLDLKNLETTYQEKNKTQTEAMQIQLKKLQQDQRNQNQDIKNLEIQLQTKIASKKQQEEFLAGVQNLSKEGIFSKNKVIEAKNEIIAIEQTINALQAEIEKAKNQLNSILLAINELNSAQSLDALDQQQKIEALQMNIRTLQKNFAENSQITSPYSGRVLEITARMGALVTPGAAIALIEQQTQEIDFEVVAYFSPLIGKQIREGMPAQISPSFVKREEYGFMEGIVRQVDRYPSTFNAVLKDIQNDSLARMLTQDTAPIKVVMALRLDKTALSGYKWSSRQGPPIEIQSGTICATAVTVKTQPPITLVIPLLKKYLFGSLESQNPS